jgi:YgiT-type zinc finger domain-containing protein
MECVICRYGRTAPGTATVTITRDAMLLVLRNVPAEVCDACGEQYFDEETTRRLEREAEDARRAGVHVLVREYLTA